MRCYYGQNGKVLVRSKWQGLSKVKIIKCDHVQNDKVKALVKSNDKVLVHLTSKGVTKLKTTKC